MLRSSKNQNLFHVLCQNSQGCKPEHLKRIYETLKKRGVNCLEQDGYGRSALHYAVQSASKELVLLLLEQGAKPSLTDAEGGSALTMYLEGVKCKTIRLFNAERGVYDEIFELLAKHGADMNVVYREKTLKSDFGGEYRCTLLLNLIRQLAHTECAADTSILRSGLLGLMHFGAKLNITDSDQRDAMSYAVMSNNTDLARYLIQNKDPGFLSIDNKDAAGKNAVHLLVKPCKFGSYENVELLSMLHAAGYQMN